MALIECSDLEMVYSSPQGEIHALNDINFDIEEGEFVSAVGPSGCGKSTLLKIVAGLLPATAGSVIYDGEPITGPRRDIGFMFQSPVLLPWRNSLENVLLPGELFGRQTKALREEAREIMDSVELGGFEDSYPWQLSGGMQQRVALARTLLYRPRLLLMDEPFGALDEFTREKMNNLLIELWSQHRNTVIFITHNIQEAVLLSDRVFVMTPRPGRLVEKISVDLDQPRSIEVMKENTFTETVFRVRELLGVSTQ